MKDLKADFKKSTFKPVYLLYGEEQYLIRYYSDLFSKILLTDITMNCDTFEGKDFDVRSVIDAAETLPFLSENRLVYIKDSGLFAAGRKNDTETLAKYLSDIPESSIIIFVESNVDKRSRLYKQVSVHGRAVECTSPSETELIKWVCNIFKKKEKNIDIDTARHFLDTVPKGMDNIYAEADKLGDYVGEKNIITRKDIDIICTKSLEARIFGLVGALCGKQTESALIQYHTMLADKEQPIMILVMIARQFRMILQCKACAEKKLNEKQIAQTLNIRDFIVRECLRQGRNYPVDRLINALSDCQDTDIKIKTGLIDGELGVELLIVRYSL